MPLDMPSASADGSTDNSTDISNPVSPEQILQGTALRAGSTASSIADVFDMLRLTRTTPSSTEQLATTSRPENPEVTQWGPTSRPEQRPTNPTEPNISTTLALGSLNLRPQDLRFNAPSISSSPTTESTQEPSAQLPPPRDRSDTSWHSFLGMLREQMEDNELLNRRSGLTRSGSSSQDILERAVHEISQPFLPPTDSAHLRNHHRHSSMSVSPRVLETGSLPSSPMTLARYRSLRESPDAHSTVSHSRHPSGRLENALILLDAQRLAQQGVSSRSLAVPNVSESSWLRPGGTYFGVQRFTGERDHSISAITRQLRSRLSPSSHQWKVEVVIDEVDYSNMSIAGSMTAYDMPDSRDRKSVTTFWTGEVSTLLTCLFIY